MSAKTASPLIAIAALLALAACSHTVEGAGRDISNAGSAIEQTGHETNDNNPNTP